MAKRTTPVETEKQSRAARVSTAPLRAQHISTVPAKSGQETVYQTLKKIWSARGEIVINVKQGIQVEVKKADIVRQLQALPRDNRSPFKLLEGENHTTILA